MKKLAILFLTIISLTACQQQKIGFVDNGILINEYQERKDIEENLNTKIEVKLINNNKNKGQSFSIYQGVKKSKYENIITMDGDCQNNPKDIERLLGFYENKSLDLIGGIRKKRKDSKLKKISSFLANKIRKFEMIENDK